MNKKTDQVFKFTGLSYRVLIALISIIFITYWLPKGGQFDYEYQQGKPWLFEDLFAPFDFAISKSPEELLKEENEIRANAKLYFVFDENIKNSVVSTFIQRIDKTGKERAFDSKKLERMREFGVEQLLLIYKYGILTKHESLKVPNKMRKVVLLRNNIAEDVEFSNFYTVNSAMEYIDQKIYFSEFVDNKAFLDEIFVGILQQNVSYDPSKTQKGIEEEIDKISQIRGFVAQNTRIISKGDIVEGETLNKLNSLKNEYESQILSESDYLWITIGHAVRVSVLIIMLMLFLHQFRSSVYEDDNKVSFVFLNLLLMIGLGSMVIYYDPKLIYVVPVSIVPIVLKSFFDSRLGLITHIVVVLIIGSMAPNAFEYTYIQITAGIVTVISVSSDHRRASMFISVGQIIFVYIISYLAYSISLKGDFTEINYYNLLWFTISGVLTLFSQPLIYMYEKMFKLVSDVSLLELSDTNSPLLKQLSDKAPGTFQHSLMVANLAESAANEIGANALLVRTGALYHDIGKMLNPLYFIENQQTQVNPHDELDPKESAKIIISHVSDGVKIAKKHNLPDRVIDFIRTHHGESMVYYFYKQYEETSNEALLSDRSFRYPGPIPYSKETAILMMCDALEAASRSLKVYDSKSIGELVEKIVSKQMEEKQFNNSNITLQEIEIVKRIIAKKLINIYHARIEYPD